MLEVVEPQEGQKCSEIGNSAYISTEISKFLTLFYN